MTITNRIVFSLSTLLMLSAPSFAKWELLQNSPTTEDLHSVFFLGDSIGWIAGNNSAIFKTVNAGASWTRLTSPEAGNFQSIFFVNRDTGWACGSNGVVIKTTNGGANWISQTFTASKFNSMDFINADVGFIIGDFGNIRKTIDGGANWISQNSGVSQNLNQIRITQDGIVAVGDNAIILTTSNSGITWQKQSGPSLGGQNINAIGVTYSSDLSRWTVVSGAVTKITDTTNSWSLGDFPMETVNSLSQFRIIKDGVYSIAGVGANGYIGYFDSEGKIKAEESPTSQTLYAIHFSSTTIGMWAVGENGTIINNYPNWEKASKYPLYTISPSLSFVSPDSGWVVGSNKLVYKTSDRGINLGANFIAANAVSSVHFANAAVGYTVGQRGEIYKTDDGGTLWDSLNSGTAEDLKSVFFIGTDTGYTVGQNGTILKTINGGITWSAQVSNLNRNLKSVFFVSAEVGYVAGEWAILKTINGGNTWTTSWNGYFSPYDDPKSVIFLNADTGFSVGSRMTGQAFAIKTVNGGASWSQIFPFANESWSSVFFINSNVGYACSLNKIFKTTNGGNSWILEEPLGMSMSGMNDIQFVVRNDTAYGYAVGDFLYRTKFYIPDATTPNSGSYPGWVPVNSGTTAFINEVKYLTTFLAFGVGGDPAGAEQGVIIRTTNGGQTWDRQQSNVASFSLNSVSFVNSSSGIAVGSGGTIVRTTNSGTTWTPQTSGTSFSLEAVDMCDLTSAFTCGFFGTMLHTPDGGTSWQAQTNGTSGGMWNSVDCISPNIATAVGSSGRIIRTTDAGLTWVAQTGGGSLNLSAVEFVNANRGLALSNDGPVLRTTDGGVTWVKTDSLTGYASDLSFIDSNNVFAVTQVAGVSRIYHSTNGGLNWVLQSTRDSTLGSISFSDANNGMISGTDGVILRTSNGGFGPVTSISKNTAKTGGTTFYQLGRNYPNPFRTITKIAFSIPASAVGIFPVKLRIFNAQGKKVAMLINRSLRPGNYSVEWNAENVPAGAYFYRLETKNFTQTKKMVVLK